MKSLLQSVAAMGIAAACLSVGNCGPTKLKPDIYGPVGPVSPTKPAEIELGTVPAGGTVVAYTSRGGCLTGAAVTLDDVSMYDFSLTKPGDMGIAVTIPRDIKPGKHVLKIWVPSKGNLVLAATVCFAVE